MILQKTAPVKSGGFWEHIDKLINGQDLVTGTVGAFLGAGFAFAFAIWLARRDRRNQTSLAMIDEFSGREMLQSRFVTSSLRERVQAGTLTLRELTMASVQGCPPGYTGPVAEGLTEHQHVSQLIGWYRRLAVQLKHNWVERKVIAATLGGSFGWSLPLLLEMADEAEALMVEFPSSRADHQRASWIYAVRYVDNQLNSGKVARHIPAGKIKS